ncbi:MAG TPA: FAD-binding oxidoreductase [Gaiellaceae bacterium]|nr:FAD-binding oxidoreductase [Gaiellaceae bacterium]
MADTALAGLAGALKGRVVARGDAGYDEARALYNGMIDKHPAAIAYCVDELDVAAAIDYAREHGLRLAVRGGGHNGAGLGSVDDGLVIDLSPMHEVTPDPSARMVRVQGGATLGAVDAATHPHGFAVPAGIISTTGVGGLTLGGGVGHLSRGGGLTIDNLLAATVVLADGSVVQTDADREPDLFWAIRGGGGNFGVVTSFSFRGVPVSTVQAGPVIYDIGDAAEVLAWYRDFMPAQPGELSGFFAFLSIPPGPPFPEELHLRKVCAVVWTYTGEGDSPALQAARSFGSPLVDGIAPVPMPAWNSAFDGVYPAGDQWYWRGEFVEEIPDAAIEQHVAYGEAMPTWKSTMHLYPIDGAPSRVGSEETAWAYRDAVWAQVIAGVDPDPANAPAISDWARAYSDAVKPYSLGTGYVNFQMQETGDRVRAMYGSNYDRLARVKAQYDPDNLFSVNQNIPPTS